VQILSRQTVLIEGKVSAEASKTNVPIAVTRVVRGRRNAISPVFSRYIVVLSSCKIYRNTSKTTFTPTQFLHRLISVIVRSALFGVHSVDGRSLSTWLLYSYFVCWLPLPLATRERLSGPLPSSVDISVASYS